MNRCFILNREEVATEVAWVELFWMLRATDEELLERLGRWYIPRRDPRYLRRNALIALGNTADPNHAESRAELRRFIEGGDDMLREHAQWAERRLDDRLEDHRNVPRTDHSGATA